MSDRTFDPSRKLPEQGEFDELLKAIEAEPVPDRLLVLATRLQDELRRRSEAMEATAAEDARASPEMSQA